MKAQFETDCPDCGGRIGVGEEIILLAEGWQHLVCPPDPLDIRPGEQPCTRCGLLHPGEC